LLRGTKSFIRGISEGREKIIYPMKLESIDSPTAKKNFTPVWSAIKELFTAHAIS